jgi:hypothetical protein
VRYPMATADSGVVLQALLSSLCPPGTFSVTGHTVAMPCVPCPAGRFASTVGSTVCEQCPLATPYSRPRAASIRNCSSCVSGCGGGGFGVSLCPSGSSWLAWSSDADDASAAGSCLTLLATPMTWANANYTCAALAAGAHLVTSSQVCDSRKFVRQCELAPIRSCLCCSCYPQLDIRPGDLLHTASVGVAAGRSAWVGGLRNGTVWSWVDGSNGSSLACTIPFSCPLWDGGAIAR